MAQNTLVGRTPMEKLRDWGEAAGDDAKRDVDHRAEPKILLEKYGTFAHTLLFATLTHGRSRR